MSDAARIVEEFMAGFGQSLEGDIAMLRRYLTDDVYFHTGTTELKSLEAAVEYLRGANKLYGIVTFRCRLRHLVADGNRVFNERWDDLIDVEGNVVAVLPIASVIEVEGDKITAWRDYFNPDELRKAVAARA